MGNRSRGRDRQRSHVYAWERQCQGATLLKETMTLVEVEASASRVWLAERARYGRDRAAPGTGVYGKAHDQHAEISAQSLLHSA